jgi:hypothetical protein
MLHNGSTVSCASTYGAMTVSCKSKVVPVPLTDHHAMRAYWGSGGIAPRILAIGSRWRWVVSLTPRPLYSQEKSPCYSLDRRLGEPQSQSGCGGEEKNSQPLAGLKPPIFQPVILCYTTELSQLLTGSCEHGNWPLGPIKSKEFLD